MLYDVERDDGERFDSVTVHDLQAVEELGEVRPIEEISLDRIRPSPFSVRKKDRASDIGLLGKSTERIREINLSGNLFSYPLVRPVDDGYELMSGHRRTAAARYANLEKLPVRITEADDWEATERFVYEHFPFPDQRPDQPNEYYSEEEIAGSLEQLRDRWPDEKLKELPQLRASLES